MRAKSRALRGLRVLKLVRILRIARIASVFPELHILISSIMAPLRTHHGWGATRVFKHIYICIIYALGS